MSILRIVRSSIRGFVRSSILGSALAASLLCLGVSSALGQSQSINGTIRGQATDASGAALPGAVISISNPDVGYSNQITSGPDGYFVQPNLPLGNYKVTVSKDGFSTLNYDKIVLNAGKEIVLDAKLAVGGANTSVEVNAEASLIDPATLNLQRTLDPREVQNLPLVSRNPYNFILFQPGVSGHPNPELGIPRTINTNGLLDRINYEMDGMVNTQSDRTGLRLFPIGNIFVKEVQTVSNSFAPEYGETTGNVYNVISNSGTNGFHGVFQYIHRWVDATAYPFFSNHSLPKPNLQLTDYSANLGGPIIKNKLFFFGSYEKLTRGSPQAVTIKAADAAALGIPADQLVAAPGLLHGTFTDERVDWNINKKNSAFVRYNYFKNNFPFNTQVGGLNTRSTASDFLDRAHVIAGQLTTTFNDNLLNELRFSWPFRNNQHFAGPSGGTGPAIVVAGAANLGASSSAGDQFTDKVPSGSENVNYIRGKHAMKFGFNFAERINRQRDLTFNQYTFSKTAAFSAIDNYLRAKSGIDPYAYTSFSSKTDSTGIGYASKFWGAYAQDTWQVSPRLIAIYGVRYDRFQGPESNPNAPYPNSRKFNIPKTNFAPRIGMSYRATDNTVIKASVGMFYQATPTNLWFNALNQDGSNRTSVYSYTVSHNAAGIGTPPAGAPAFPSVPSTVGNTSIQDVTTISPKFKNEYTWNATAQVSQQLSRYDSLLIGYIMANGRNLQLQHNINLINPIGTLADGRPVFGGCNPVGKSCSSAYRADPRFNNITQVDSGANSSFNALVVNYTHMISRGIQLNANYTWSHALSNAPEVNTFEVSPSSSSIEDTTNRHRDYGNASVNHPNAFNLTAVMEPTFALNNRFVNEIANHNMLAVLANISSGDQASIFTGSAQNGDSTVTSITRPAFVGRNTVRSPKIVQFDARYTRSFTKLFDRISPEFFIEAQNLFNHTNVTNIATVQPVTSFNPLIAGPNGGIPVGSATVNRTSVLEARIVQFGLAARF